MTFGLIGPIKSEDVSAFLLIASFHKLVVYRRKPFLAPAFSFHTVPLKLFIIFSHTGNPECKLIQPLALKCLKLP